MLTLQHDILQEIVDTGQLIIRLDDIVVVQGGAQLEIDLGAPAQVGRAVAGVAEQQAAVNLVAVEHAMDPRDLGWGRPAAIRAAAAKEPRALGQRRVHQRARQVLDDAVRLAHGDDVGQRQAPRPDAQRARALAAGGFSSGVVVERDEPGVGKGLDGGGRGAVHAAGGVGGVGEARRGRAHLGVENVARDARGILGKGGVQHRVRENGGAERVQAVELPQDEAEDVERRLREGGFVCMHGGGGGGGGGGDGVVA